mgnify:CR=1 FL=1
MSIKSDKWIRRMAAQHKMIEPFEAGQVLGDRLPVGTRRLHAHMDGSRPLFGQPGAQGLKAARGILHHFVAQLSPRQAQCAIKLGLGDIDTEYVFHVRILAQSTL